MKLNRHFDHVLGQLVDGLERPKPLFKPIVEPVLRRSIDELFGHQVYSKQMPHVIVFTKVDSDFVRTVHESVNHIKTKYNTDPEYISIELMHPKLLDELQDNEELRNAFYGSSINRIELNHIAQYFGIKEVRIADAR